MTKAERATLRRILDQADTLLNAPPKQNPTIRNIDVLEAVLSDLTHVVTGQYSGTQLADLIKQDAEEN